MLFISSIPVHSWNIEQYQCAVACPIRYLRAVTTIRVDDDEDTTNFTLSINRRFANLQNTLTTLSRHRSAKQKRVIGLPDLSARVFRVYHHCLLTGRLNCSLGPSAKQHGKELTLLIEAALLGDYLEDTAFGDVHHRCNDPLRWYSAAMVPVFFCRLWHALVRDAS